MFCDHCTATTGVGAWYPFSKQLQDLDLVSCVTKFLHVCGYQFFGMRPTISSVQPLDELLFAVDMDFRDSGVPTHASGIHQSFTLSQCNCTIDQSGIRNRRATGDTQLLESNWGHTTFRKAAGESNWGHTTFRCRSRVRICLM